MIRILAFAATLALTPALALAAPPLWVVDKPASHLAFSSAVSASSAATSTAPSHTLAVQHPQNPSSHEKGTASPASSAARRIDLPA